jgi:hypothetical protein
MLPFSMQCPFLIAPSVFFNVYLDDVDYHFNVYLDDVDYHFNVYLDDVDYHFKALWFYCFQILLNDLAFLCFDFECTW